MRTFLTLLSAMAISFTASANSIQKGTTTSSVLDEVGIFQLKSASVVSSEDLGDGMFQAKIKLVLTVEGNICQADPNTLEAFVERSNDLRLFVKSIVGKKGCQEMSYPTDINLEMDRFVLDSTRMPFFVQKIKVRNASTGKNSLISISAGKNGVSVSVGE